MFFVFVVFLQLIKYTKKLLQFILVLLKSFSSHKTTPEDRTFPLMEESSIYEHRNSVHAPPSVLY